MKCKCIVRADFGVVRNLVAPFIVGETCIDRFVKCIFPPEKKVVPYSPERVPMMLLTMQASKDDQRDNNQERLILLVESRKVYSKQV